MSDLAWRFYVWMCKPSKLKGLAWRFFFWITPRWLSKKFQMYVLRCYVERYPGEMERKISAFLRASIPATAEALAPLIKLEAQQSGATQSEEEIAALSKQFLDLMLHPEARAAFLKSARTPDAH